MRALPPYPSPAAHHAKLTRPSNDNPSLCVLARFLSPFTCTIIALYNVLRFLSYALDADVFPKKKKKKNFSHPRNSDEFLNLTREVENLKNDQLNHCAYDLLT